MFFILWLVLKVTTGYKELLRLADYRWSAKRNWTNEYTIYPEQYKATRRQFTHPLKVPKAPPPPAAWKGGVLYNCFYVQQT
ncbi:hypothetical protein, partial [Pontibacter silvestris]